MFSRTLVRILSGIQPTRWKEGQVQSENGSLSSTSRLHEKLLCFKDALFSICEATCIYKRLEMKLKLYKQK